jgi:tetratricopeptide (TPR) repeat protein/tRNA A-37 threonylcarbamoyl transferase component Bud32
VAGPYRIEERIGQGGMGEVYRATHQRLGHTVAVKSIRSELAESGAARERFAREMRMACRVSHPYVATVFDVVEHQGLLLLVMEYVDGKPMRRILQEDPNPQDLVRWSVEIAEALAAIHRAGLVHRDVKPGNVMVTSDGHVKVMDFGLARALPPQVAADGTTVTQHPSLTAEGARVGTPNYMSPEQLRGEEVDQRSDLFSYGILLYEAFTGVHPFSRSSVVESASAILTEAPRGGDLPGGLSSSGELRRILDRALEKSCEERYQSADEALADLQRWSRDTAARPPRSAVRSLVTALAIALLAILVLGGAGYWWLAKPAAWDRPRLSLAIAPFDVRTGDDEITGVMVADLLATDLAASSVVRALGPGRTEPVLHNLRPDSGTDAVGAALHSALSVDHVLLGQLYREGDRLIAAIEFPRLPGQETPIPAVRVEAESYRALAERAATAVRRHLPDVPLVTAWRDDRLDLSTILSGSEEAQQAFQRGLLAGAAENPAAAIRHFEEAVGQDPGFALAHARLAESLLRAGYGRRARESATTALELIPEGEDRATRRLRLMVQAIRDRVFGRVEAAIGSTAELASLFPDEPLLLQMSAEALRLGQRYAEAMTRLDLALAIEPGNALARLGRISALRSLGRYDEALAEADKTSTLLTAAGNEEALSALELERAKILWDLERYAEARTHLVAAARGFASAGRDISAADAWLEAGKLDVSLGHLAAADATLEEALAVAERAGNLGIESDVFSIRGYQAAGRGDFAGAEVAFRKAIDIARQLENDVLLMDPLTNLAGIQVYEGRLEDARPILAEAAELAAALGRKDAEIAIRLNLSDVDTRLGRIREAIDRLRGLLDAVDGPPDRMETRAHRSLALAYHQLGRLSEALAAADKAVDNTRRLSLPADLAWSLIVRAEIYSSLGDGARAETDLGVTREFIESPDSDQRELAVRAEVARAQMLADRGRWPDVLRLVRSLLQGDEVGGERGGARILECRAYTSLGRHDEAIRLCTALSEDDRLPLAERVVAGAYLAEALARSGRHAPARELAESTFRRADEIGLRLSLAHAASTLARVARAEGEPLAQHYVETGLGALQAYAESAASIDETPYVPTAENEVWKSLLTGD